MIIGVQVPVEISKGKTEEISQEIEQNSTDEKNMRGNIRTSKNDLGSPADN